MKTLTKLQQRTLRRLTNIANAIVRPTRKLKEFNFGFVINDCGTAGCAWGEATLRYDWARRSHAQRAIRAARRDSYCSLTRDAICPALQGLSTQQARSLFIPDEPPFLPSEKQLSSNSSAKAVSRNMLRFVAAAKAGRVALS